MENFLEYKDMCNKAGFPQKPQLLWQIGALITALSFVAEIFKVVKLIRSQNKVDNALGKSKIPLLAAMGMHTFIYIQAVSKCHLYSRILPTMFFSAVMQFVVLCFFSMFV